MGDVNINHVVERRRAARLFPDLTRQHFPRDEMALMSKQILQQLEFARGQIEESITARGAARHEVQLQVGSL